MYNKVVQKTFHGGIFLKTFKSVMRKQEETDVVVCNMCGRKAEKNDFGYQEEFLEINHTWGYHSEFDGETHSFDICPHCYKEMIQKFLFEVRENRS